MLEFALCGNPNVGKTSLYNRLTRSFEHVGNWHGVTIKSVKKTVSYKSKSVTLTDLPGLYSLTVYSPEERVSRDAVLFGKNDIVISVCEVNNLVRNLYLTLQLLEAGVKTVLAVNMMDELKKQGGVFNADKLRAALGIPVVGMSAKYRTDTGALMDACINYNAKAVKLDYLDILPVKQIALLIKQNAQNAGLSPEFAAIKILENDSEIAEKLNLSQEQQKSIGIYGDLQAAVSKARYDFIAKITEGVIIKKRGGTPIHGYSRADKVLLNKYLALVIFFLIMAAIFLLTFSLIGPLFSNLLSALFEKFLYAPATHGLYTIGAPQWVVSLAGDAVIRGLGSVLVFLPQIVLLFFFLSMLEDSGYISRVAFMTDGLFKKIGLSGRSVFTMLMGFGCAATAVMTARALEDETLRKKTVFLTPFMSCSARLPVYAVIASAYFAISPLLIFLLYILGAAAAVCAAAVMQKINKLKTPRLSFIMEMPPYRMPTFERVWQLIWHNTKAFLIRVGTTVFALNVIIWVLSSFSFTFEYTAESGMSMLQSMSMLIAPVFKPLGFGNWKAATALLSGFAAKELVISSINSLGGVTAVFTDGYTALSALCFLVFTLLYVPCVAALGAIGKEAGFKWAAASAAVQLLTAYAAALAVRGAGLLFIKHFDIAIILCALLALSILYAMLRPFFKRFQFRE